MGRGGDPQPTATGARSLGRRTAGRIVAMTHEGDGTGGRLVYSPLILFFVFRFDNSPLYSDCVS